MTQYFLFRYISPPLSSGRPWPASWIFNRVLRISYFIKHVSVLLGCIRPHPLLIPRPHDYTTVHTRLIRLCYHDACHNPNFLKLSHWCHSDYSLMILKSLFTSCGISRSSSSQHHVVSLLDLHQSWGLHLNSLSSPMVSTPNSVVSALVPTCDCLVGSPGSPPPVVSRQAYSSTFPRLFLVNY